MAALPRYRVRAIRRLTLRYSACNCAMTRGFRNLEDAMVVQAHLEKRMSERIKEHAAFIERHENSMAEFDKKLKALIDIVTRRETGSA